MRGIGEEAQHGGSLGVNVRRRFPNLDRLFGLPASTSSEDDVDSLMVACLFIVALLCDRTSYVSRKAVVVMGRAKQETSSVLVLPSLESLWQLIRVFSSTTYRTVLVVLYCTVGDVA